MDDIQFTTLKNLRQRIAYTKVIEHGSAEIAVYATDLYALEEAIRLLQDEKQSEARRAAIEELVALHRFEYDKLLRGD